MKRMGLIALLALCLWSTAGCSGGQEIEDCLFVISMAVDPAPGGNLRVTVKALSGTQEAAPQQGGDAGESAGMPGDAAAETEPGYVVLSATAQSCLHALDLLGATTPRTVNLSQLQEIVLSRTLAQTDATLSVLREIYALFEANGDAFVVVTPDDAGDFIRRQYAMFGVRLSQYLRVLFDNYAQLGTIPPNARLGQVIAAMESSAGDACAVYAAGNDFSSTLVLSGEDVTDRLPGHLPRTSPAQNEYLGSAVFSGARMVGTLTGDETTVLRLLRGEQTTTSFVLGGAMMQVKSSTRVRREVQETGGAPVLCVSVRMRLTRAAGDMQATQAEIAANIERSAVGVIEKLKAMDSDAVGFGLLAMRRQADIPAWEAYDWRARYPAAQAQVHVDLRID